jgi:N-acetylmuramoyl-L-alanine amidase
MRAGVIRAAGAFAIVAAGGWITGCAGSNVTAHGAGRPSAAATAPGSTAAPSATATGRPGHGPAGAAGPLSTRSPGPSGRAPASRPLAGRVITLDPGHNGANASNPAIINGLVNVISEWKACDTVGAQTDAGYPEHAFNFDVAMRLAALLRAEGATVVLTRSNDTGVGPCVTQRAAIGNQAHADAAISVHADGGPPTGSGFEVIEPGLISGHNDAIIGPSHRLALDIRNAYQRITGEPYADYIGTSGLDVRTDLGGLNLSTVPKVFIECANMRNATDAARLASPQFRQRVAVALAAGFVAFLSGSGP